MATKLQRTKGIILRGARENNLRDIDVDIPHGSLTVVTGVSGSGKSSLAFDTLFREGQRRYLESLSSYARLTLGKLERPAAERIEGVLPALAIDQRAAISSPRSTVGTVSELYDYLRLLFARVGKAAEGEPGTVNSTLFSFNTPLGACPDCGGLGVDDYVDPELLIADQSLTLRQGALVPTTPNGYIVYSQVTVEVLDLVCQKHGFSVDQPWCELTEEQRRVVLYGSDRLQVPFGKHPLESRLRWTGITARTAGPAPASRAARSSTDRLKVSSSTSTSSGVAPASRIAFAVATWVSDGMATTSPGPTPAATSARCSAVVPEVVATACAAPT